jgi:ComF family protein
LYAIFSYDPPITKLITGLKFGDQLYSGRLLGELLVEHVENKWYKDEMLPEAIIPVPLHEKRLRKRGFNQVVELLGPLKKKLDIPILRHACVRKKITKAQSGLNSTQRKQNIKNAFVIPDISEFAGLDYVAVVDDVVTTGSTVNALCAVLKEAGVQQIDVWCICRA